jgi:hypothetical protein
MSMPGLTVVDMYFVAMVLNMSLEAIQWLDV